MSTLEDLARGRSLSVPTIEPLLDALRHPDVLMECWLIDMRVTVLTNRAVLVFDTRGALQLDVGYVAVVIVDGLIEASWSSKGREQRARSAWTVMDSRCILRDGSLAFKLAFYPDAELTVVGREFRFFAGHVPGVEGAPPDFGEADDEELWAGEPTWDKEFTPLAGSHRVA